MDSEKAQQDVPRHAKSADSALPLLEKIERDVQSLKLRLGEPPLISEMPSATAAKRLRRMIRARRARNDFFGDDLFADPAWDMLLEAYAAFLAEQRISVSALCHVASVPMTTGLRWLNKLVEKGLLVRHDDPLDGRRSWVELSPAGRASMWRYLEALSQGLPL